MNKAYIFLLFLCFCSPLFAQNELKIKAEVDTDTAYTIDPLSPATAAFYSAVLPGLGQAYNKKYWKVPVVYVAIGTGLYFYLDNNKQYNRYRDAYKSRLAGFNNDEFQNLDTGRLITAQRLYQKNKELSLIITVGLYVLNIVDASVDAHLLQFNVNENLSLHPDYQFGEETQMAHTVGLKFNYRF
ncbi:MAG: hypothetical protein H6584_07060 [Flavobacteriales bacterium]|nr:hypothetical protein [Flavobacteriales bacterium]